MTNKNTGQIRVGKSGPMTIGNDGLQPSLEGQHISEQESKIISDEGDLQDSKSLIDEYPKKSKEKTIISICKVDKFNFLVKNNKSSGKPWYYGLEGDWWWGMTEDEARIRLKDVERVFEKGSQIAIVSIIRNEERNGNLKRFLDCCRDLERYYENIVYIFIEGDSSDGTYGMLKNWLIPKKSYILKKVDRNYRPFAKDRNPVRTIYFAELRNMLIDLSLSIPEVSDVLMIDANYWWKGDLISSLGETGADISAPLIVTRKNYDGRYLFYDTWAFRKDGRQFSQFYPYAVGLGSKPLDLDSVGGGYLIKREVLESGVRYNGDKDCEHVGFCKMAKDMGFSIKINPKFRIRKGGS